MIFKIICSLLEFSQLSYTFGYAMDTRYHEPQTHTMKPHVVRLTLLAGVSLDLLPAQTF